MQNQVSDVLPSLQANGNLVKVLIHTDVTKYLEFKAVDGSYVMNKGRVEKARGPVTVTLTCACKEAQHWCTLNSSDGEYMGHGRPE